MLFLSLCMLSLSKNRFETKNKKTKLQLQEFIGSLFSMLIPTNYFSTSTTAHTVAVVVVVIVVVVVVLVTTWSPTGATTKRTCSNAL